MDVTAGFGDAEGPGCDVTGILQSGHIVKGEIMGHEMEVAISCSDCVRRSTPDCQDCLVSFVLGETPEELVMNSEDARIVELFSAEGMLPTLRYRSATVG